MNTPALFTMVILYSIITTPSHDISLTQKQQETTQAYISHVLSEKRVLAEQLMQLLQQRILTIKNIERRYVHSSQEIAKLTAHKDEIFVNATYYQRGSYDKVCHLLQQAHDRHKEIIRRYEVALTNGIENIFNGKL